MQHHQLQNLVVVIPSFCPGDELIKLVTTLKETDLPNIIIVNDGSPRQFNTLFAEAKLIGSIVIQNSHNMGKGDALKTGIRTALELFPNSSHILCCDDDGQHTPQDIHKIAHFATTHNSPFTLGVRNFHSNTPLKSKIGNFIINRLLRLILNVKVKDSQTGLRCYDRNVAISLLTMKGSRFSFETSSLIQLLHLKITPYEIPIATVYFDKNKKTRFHAWRDSYQVLQTLLVNFTIKFGEK